MNEEADTGTSQGQLSATATSADPLPRRLAIRLTTDALRHVRNGHPWVYDQSVVRAEQADTATPGDLAVVFDDRRRFVGIGLWDPNSPICIKMIHVGGSTTINESFWRDRVRRADEIRQPLRDRNDTTGYRVIHGENDGFPGMVVDRYDGTLVAKVYSEAWFVWLPILKKILIDELAPERIVVRLSRELQSRTNDFVDGQVLHGSTPTRPVRFLEHGLTFEADVLTGQKTGHFLDQRDNRAAVRNMSRGKRVLDLFSSTGGFTVHAAAGGAREIVSIDSSEPTLAVVARNLRHNGTLTRATVHRAVADDAFGAMEDLLDRRELFDIVVIDPPAFARRKDEVRSALSAYRRLAQLGAQLVARGGVMVACSCSSRVTKEDFFDAVQSGVESSRRRANVLATTGHAVDHPISFAEGTYLKAIFLRF